MGWLRELMRLSREGNRELGGGWLEVGRAELGRVDGRREGCGKEAREGKWLRIKFRREGRRNSAGTKGEVSWSTVVGGLS